MARCKSKSEYDKINSAEEMHMHGDYSCVSNMSYMHMLVPRHIVRIKISRLQMHTNISKTGLTLAEIFQDGGRMIAGTLFFPSL